MRRMLGRLAGGALLLASTAAIADGVDAQRHVAPPPPPPPPPASVLGIQWELGGRYWVSSGGYTKELYSVLGVAMVSKLTYDDLTAHAGELFFRGDHNTGLFLKGFVGGGAVTDGHMNDEDFPPFIAYTNTLQQQHDGDLSYFTVDFGYTFLKNGSPGSFKDGPTPWTYRLGGFIGFNYWRERLNTFGCYQTAVTGYACGVETDFNGLDNDAEWRLFRIGVSGDLVLTNLLSDRWRLSAEAAYITGAVDLTDWHNMRADIRGIREDAASNGVQLEAILSYRVSPSFTLGVGGRWWTLSGDGNTHFEDKGGEMQPIKINADRIGVFVQGAIRLD